MFQVILLTLLFPMTFNTHSQLLAHMPTQVLVYKVAVETCINNPQLSAHSCQSISFRLEGFLSKGFSLQSQQPNRPHLMRPASMPGTGGVTYSRMALDSLADPAPQGCCLIQPHQLRFCPCIEKAFHKSQISLKFTLF